MFRVASLRLCLIASTTLSPIAFAGATTIETDAAGRTVVTHVPVVKPSHDIEISLRAEPFVEMARDLIEIEGALVKAQQTEEVKLREERIKIAAVALKLPLTLMKGQLEKASKGSTLAMASLGVNPTLEKMVGLTGQLLKTHVYDDVVEHLAAGKSPGATFGEKNFREFTREYLPHLMEWALLNDRAHIGAMIDLARKYMVMAEELKMAINAFLPEPFQFIPLSDEERESGLFTYTPYPFMKDKEGKTIREDVKRLNREELIDAIQKDSKRHRKSLAHLYPITGMLRLAELATVLSALKKPEFRDLLVEKSKSGTAQSGSAEDGASHVKRPALSLDQIPHLLLSRALCRNERNKLRAFLGYQMGDLQVLLPAIFTDQPVVLTDMERLHFARDYPAGSIFTLRKNIKGDSIEVSAGDAEQVQALDGYTDHWSLILSTIRQNVDINMQGLRPATGPVLAQAQIDHPDFVNAARAHFAAERMPVHIKPHFRVVLRQAVKDLRKIIAMAQGKLDASLKVFAEKETRQKEKVANLRSKLEKAEPKKKKAAQNRLKQAEDVLNQMKPQRAVWDREEIQILAKIMREYLILYNDMSLHNVPSLQEAMITALGEDHAVGLSDESQRMAIEKIIPADTDIIFNNGTRVQSSGLENWLQSFEHDAHIPTVKYLISFIQSLYYFSATDGFEVGDENVWGGADANLPLDKQISEMQRYLRDTVHEQLLQEGILSATEHEQLLPDIHNTPSPAIPYPIVETDDAMTMFQLLELGRLKRAAGFCFADGWFKAAHKETLVPQRAHTVEGLPAGSRWSERDRIRVAYETIGCRYPNSTDTLHKKPRAQQIIQQRLAYIDSFAEVRRKFHYHDQNTDAALLWWGENLPQDTEHYLRALQWRAQGHHMTYEHRLESMKAMVKGLTNKKVRTVFNEAVERIPDETPRESFRAFVADQQTAYLRGRLVEWLEDEWFEEGKPQNEAWVRAWYPRLAPWASDARIEKIVASLKKD